jgi:hypothetical protein
VSLRHDLRKAEHRGPPAGAPREPHAPALTVETRIRAYSLLPSPERTP